MERELILTFTILIITTLFFMFSRVRADLIALFSLLTLVLTGVISIGDALQGFSNSVVIMIAGLFIVGGGIFRTGLAKMAGNLLLKWAGKNETKLLILLMLIVAILSAFMSNTGTVAVLMPVVVSIALSMGVSPAQFLIPLAFSSSLGGVLTLIGTPPNLVVSEILADFEFEKLAFFDFTPIGLVALITGMLYMATIGRKLLPKSERNTNGDSQKKRTVRELVKNYQVTDKLFKVKIPKESSLVGKKLADLKLPANYQICVLEIERTSTDGHHKLLPMTYHRMAGPKTTLREDDILYLLALPEQVEQFCSDCSVEQLERSSMSAKSLVSKELGVAEVLLTPQSSLINETIKNVGFREKYNLNIIAVNRRGKYIMQNMSELKLRFGDALLVQGSWTDLELLAKETRDVVVIGQPKEEASMAATNGKAPIAAIIMLFMLVLMTLEIVPAVTAVMIAALLMIATGCLRNIDDAYGHINWESVILIGAMLPMATALEQTGGVQLIANFMIDSLGGYGPLAILAGFYLATTIFSQFISNTATAVLFAPIAITAAISMGVSPYPFMIAVTIAASMAFATPVASPTNALVMTAGGYRFIDFVKVGIPLQIVIFIVMMIAIPFFFPF